jgi:hypothetical protein
MGDEIIRPIDEASAKAITQVSIFGGEIVDGFQACLASYGDKDAADKLIFEQFLIRFRRVSFSQCSTRETFCLNVFLHRPCACDLV